MKTALDAPLETLDRQEQRFVEKVRQFGWHGTHVAAEPGRPGFSYSTAFWVGTQRPEWIIFGMNIETANHVLWDGFRDSQSGQELIHCRKTDSIFSGIPAYTFRVAKRHYPKYLGWSRWFYGGDDFPCLQIVWPDRAGKFPWERGFDDALRGDQPDLTENGWQAALAC